LSNVIATHHTAGVSHDARYTTAKIAAEQIRQILNGERGPRIVNKEVWPIYNERFAEKFNR
jgi:D-3-phosphoglycerate dehydrogenase